MTRRGAASLLVALLLSGCTSADPRPADPGPPVAGASSPSAAPSPRGTVRLVVGDVALQVEVADSPQERSDGLRGRTVVPPGTGMVFRYDSPREVRFTMAGVEPPLVAVFAREGRVVAVEQMAPCAGTIAECPTYGPAEPVDTVVEAAPESLPDVRVGDTVT